MPAATATAASPSVITAAATSRSTASSTSSATRWTSPRPSCAWSTTPTAAPYIALVQYEDGEKRYIIAPVGLKAGDKVISSAAADIKPGNCLPIANIPVGTVIHNIEMHPGKGAQLVRSAGTAAQLMAKEGGDAQIRMPSGEVRIVRTELHGRHRPGRQHRSRERPDR